MEAFTMGRVLVKATIENLRDLYDVEQNRLNADDVHRLDLDKALVDTGATFLSLRPSMIKTLGLKRYRRRTAKTAAGERKSGMYEAVRLTVQGRDCTVDVAEVAEGSPALIGQIPLEAMDFIVDPRGRRLIGNPEH